MMLQQDAKVKSIKQREEAGFLRIETTYGLRRRPIYATIMLLIPG